MPPLLNPINGCAIGWVRWQPPQKTLGTIEYDCVSTCVVSIYRKDAVIGSVKDVPRGIGKSDDIDTIIRFPYTIFSITRSPVNESR